MKAFKGFNEDLTCTPIDGVKFQYEVGKEYEEPEADLCNNGFHACEFPLDCLGYYSPAKSRYCEVELGDVSEEEDIDSKRVGKRIHIKAEIGLPGLIKAGVDYIKEHVDWEHAKKSNTGDRSAATNTGYQSAATNTGYQSAATNTGDRSAATNTGDRSAATNTGDQSAAVVSGSDSVAMAMGIESHAKGAVGCFLVLAEWLRDDNCNWHIKDMKAVRVDGKIIKADTFYRLKDGNFVEVEDNEVWG